jgi:hypothetical protein
VVRREALSADREALWAQIAAAVEPGKMDSGFRRNDERVTAFP